MNITVKQNLIDLWNWLYNRRKLILGIIMILILNFAHLIVNGW